MRPIRIAIVGTGTEVGKTHLGCSLARALRHEGRPLLALKPLETGFTDAERSDAANLARAAQHPVVLPLFTSPLPVAPLRAAAAVGVELTPEEACRWVQAHEALHRAPLTLIETAGGLFTPISARATNVNLIQAFAVDRCLLVARDRLGVLHDVLALRAALGRAWDVPTAVVLNRLDESVPPGSAEDLATCGVDLVLDNPDGAALLAWLDAPPAG